MTPLEEDSCPLLYLASRKRQANQLALCPPVVTFAEAGNSILNIILYAVDLIHVHYVNSGNHCPIIITKSTANIQGSTVPLCERGNSNLIIVVCGEDLLFLWFRLSTQTFS
jgi:hypothetical protein